MRKGLLLTLTVVALAATATLFGLIGPEGAVGAGQPNSAVGTLEIEGLTDEGTNEPIDVFSYSWGATQTGTGGAGGGGGAGKVNFGDLSFTKAFDELSPVLVRALATGEHFAKATLLVDANGPPSNKPTHKYVFRELILSSVQHGGSGGQQQLTEHVSFSYAALELTNE
jgi:type VI secretion system secreted protein Hcp